MDLCVLNLDFMALQPIRSLPRFHGARWSAVFRLACRAAGVDIEQAVHGLLPLRQGIKPVLVGEIMTVRLLVPRHGLHWCPALIAVLRAGFAGSGEFRLGRNLRLDGMRCALSGQMVDETSLVSLDTLDMDHVRGVIDALRTAARWTLHLRTPLRLPRPEGMRQQGHHYCDPSFFAAHPREALIQLIAKIRGTGIVSVENGACPRLLEADLEWEDMRYSKVRSMALGGVTGALILSGAPCSGLAERFALGEFTGAGKNPRFGLGYYVLEV